MPPVYAGQRVTGSNVNSDLAILTTGSVSNSNTEQIIGTFSNGYPAGDATLVSTSYDMVIFGTWDCTGTPTIQFRVRLGSTIAGPLLFDSTARTASGAGTVFPFNIRVWFCVTATGVSGTYDSGAIASIQNVANQPCGGYETAQAINTTAASNIIVTAQYGTANASNAARTTGGLMARM